MIVPHLFHFSGKKLDFRPIPIFSCAIARAFEVGRAPCLGSPKFFRAIKYDLGNHSHRPSMIVPHVLHFSAKKLEFCPIPIFSCAVAHAFQLVPGPPDPDNLKFFRAINYDLRNHSHRPDMTFPHFLCFTAKKLEICPIHIFSCAIAHAFQVVPGPPDPDHLKFFWAIEYDLRNHSHHPAMIIPHFCVL